MSDQNVHVKVLNADGPTPAEVNFRTGQLPTPYQFTGYRYTLESMQSVIALIHWKGALDNSVLFVDEDGVQVILNDTVTDRPKDTAIYEYKQSMESKEWFPYLGSRMKQKDFADFLKRRTADEIDGSDHLLASVQKLNLATVITGEYDYEDNNNLVVGFKVKDAEGSTRLPKVLTVHMPLIYGSEFVVDMEVELEFSKPKAEGEKPTFALSIPKWNRYWQAAVEFEVDKLKKALEGYLVLDGRGLK